MITTTDAPAWLRRSDQAITWARDMLAPDRAVVIDCETTDLPGAICEVAVVDTQGRSLLNICWSTQGALSRLMPPASTTSPTTWLSVRPVSVKFSPRFYE